MRKQLLVTVALVLLIVGLVAQNYELAYGHRWSSWHWDKSTISTWISSCQPEGEAARYDWSANTDLYLQPVNYHTDISVFCGNFGATGWWGLASIENSDWDWHCWWWCKVSHGHARFNTYYGGSTGTGTGSDRRGVLCQEIGHLFGLDHSNTGDCMGKGYWNNINVVGPHNVSDINSMY
jgi:hypothetical protein